MARKFDIFRTRMRNGSIVRTSIIVAIVISSLAIVSFVLSSEFKPVVPEINQSSDYGCGDKRMITREIPGKEKKEIYLVENLVKATPHLGCRMWNTYDIVAKIALDVYAEGNPTYQPVIHFFNEQAPELDPIRPSHIVETTAASSALATVGFAWSAMAGVAAHGASDCRMPYVSPTGVIKSINQGGYSVSLGLPLSSMVNGFDHLMRELGSPHILIVENTSQIQEREFAEALKEKWAYLSTTIEYQGDFPEEKVLALLRGNLGQKYLVVVPGYVTVKEGVEAILKSFPPVPVLVGPQWSHDHRLLDLKGDVYCISDYYNFLDNDLHNLVTKKWYENGGEEIIGGYLYSLFDAILFTLKSLDGAKSREDVRHKIKNFGDFSGAKGDLTVKENVVYKQIYVLKYENRQGFKLVAKIKS